VELTGRNITGGQIPRMRLLVVCEGQQPCQVVESGAVGQDD
jgi:hypothetical protein